MKHISIILLFLCGWFTIGPSVYAAKTVKGWKKADNALWIQTRTQTLRLQPYTGGILSVQWGNKEDIQNNHSYAVTETPVIADFHVQENKSDIRLQCTTFTLVVDKQSGALQLLSLAGTSLIKEQPDTLLSQSDNHAIRKSFTLQPDEAIYGLGQFRDSLLNLRGTSRELIQFNSQAAIPVVYSTAGWGLLWDNPSRTLFTDSAEGMTFHSDCGKVISYYLFVGNGMDQLVQAYRTLTGAVPMMPDWALGYHQSRNKYATQNELMEVSRRMQQEDIPMSSIFIDYFYWQKYGTGSHRFDETLFPNIPEMLDSLHRVYDTHAVLTIWPTFSPETENYKEFAEKGMILKGEALDGYVYDAFNPEAAEIYRRQLKPLYQSGIDGWFLDGPEPDQPASFLKSQTYAGPAAEVQNIYPLVHAANFLKGLQETRPNQRPYLLTRCAWAAQQKLGTAVWSGDIPTTFGELARQVVAGLNFVATGIPYWTTDIGGYYGGDPADEAYREVFVRWFQYGTFCPIFRAHGRRYPGDTTVPNELWAYGERAQKICTDYIRLRYSLFPYIYSMTGDVTQQGYTPMRLLAFDFADDREILDCKDQFMYGPVLMVCPVLQAGATSRSVYLPKGCNWVDFHTGKSYTGGQQITADAPLEQIPLYIKAGSILPLYPTLHKRTDTHVPMEIRICRGGNAKFDLYEDDGTTLGYQQGEFSRIPLTWDEQNSTLTIGNRRGRFKGMNFEREFRITLQGETDRQPVTVKYNGEPLTLNLKK